MTPHYTDDAVTVYAGDCLNILPTLPAGSVDAVVTDPPYDLTAVSRGGSARVAGSGPYGRHTLDTKRGGFMGKEWDGTGVAFRVDLWEQCLRVLKPGGHLLAFGGTRTYHRLTCAIEDAGFEVRDCIMWIYAQGFPKSLDVSKAIDKANGDPLAFIEFARAYAAAVNASPLTHTAIDRHLGIFASSCYWAREDHRGGMPPRHHWDRLRELLDLPDDLTRLYDRAEREVVASGYRVRRESDVQIVGLSDGEYPITAPATDDAKRWAGWGTALKPSHEPIVVARKPLAGTVAGNVVRYGTGALNIDATRVVMSARDREVINGMGGFGRAGWTRPDGTLGEVYDGTVDGSLASRDAKAHDAGRWPTNVVLSHVPLHDGDGQPVGDGCADGCVDGCPVAELDRQSGDRMPGARPAYRADLGYHGNGSGTRGKREELDGGGASRFFPVFRYEAKADSNQRPRVNGIAHATVKPVDLMRWLVRLVTPPGGVVLDPFLGSGTTAEACVVEGFRCVGVEREPTYLPLIVARLAKPLQPVLDWEAGA